MADSDGVTAPADAADATLQAPTPVSMSALAFEATSAPTSGPASGPTSSSTWRIGPVAVATGLAVSVLVHLALLGTAVFVSPLLGRPAPVYAVPVELVTPEQVAEEKASAKPDKPDKPDRPDDSTKPDPQAQTQQAQTQQAQAQPQSQPQAPAPSQPPPAGSPSTASLPLPPPTLPVDAFSLPSPPASHQAAAPAPPSGQAEQLAKLIGLPVAGPSGGPSDVKANLTRDQIAAFASHLQSCWTSPADVAADPKIYVVIRVSLRRDGTLAASPEVVAGSASMSALAIKQSAVNALEHCPAYGDLPADKYNEWRLLDLRFTPSGLSTATPVTGGQRASPRPG